MIVFFYGKELMKLILAITRDNEKLICEVCKENGFENPQVLTGVDSLKKFAVQELRNLNNYKQIIIDIASTKETENEIVQAVVAIKSMYNIKIIIVALGFQEGNSLLAKLFNEGIYNFVNASTYFEQKEQFRNCFSFLYSFLIMTLFFFPSSSFCLNLTA